MRRLPLSIAIVVSVIAVCRIARADEPKPEAEDTRPQAALTACASGDTAKGVAILGELYAQSLNPAYVFNQGRCYQKNGQLEQARVRFDEYLRIGTKEPPEDIQRAQGFIKEIDAALAQQRANAPAPVVVAPAEDREGRRRMLRTTSIVLAAVGVAAVGVGAFMSFKVKSTNDSIDQLFAGQSYVTDEARLEQLMSDGKSYQTWQWVGYGLGVAALGGAATTFLLSGGFGGSGPAATDHAAVTFVPTFSPGGAGGIVQARF